MKPGPDQPSLGLDSTRGSHATAILDLSEPALTDAQLLQVYSREDFLFSSGRGTLLLRPEETATLQPEEILPEVARLLEAHTVVAGSLPFDSREPAHFLAGSLPLHGPRLGEPRLGGTNPASDSSPLLQITRDAVTREASAQQYQQAVATAVERMEQESSSGAKAPNSEPLEKVVLARSVRAEVAQGVDVASVLSRLAAQNSHAYVFAAPLPEAELTTARQPRLMLGASPELLIRREGNQVVSNPLAGSLPRSFDPEIDAERAARLLQSAKDLREHAIVAHMVGQVLAPWCSQIDVPESPEILYTNTMMHLSTRISGELKPLASGALPNSLELALALHPTPAVGGWPHEAAREAILDLEPVDRGFYAGAVGWMDRSGDGEWAVTIRCAEVSALASHQAGHTESRSETADQVRVFAGAGIVVGSKPELELAETEAKLRTMQIALGFQPLQSEELLEQRSQQGSEA